MSRTFEPPWEWPSEQRERAIRTAYAVRSAVGNVRDARVGQERRVPISIITHPDVLADLKECYRYTEKSRYFAASIRVLGEEVRCHPQEGAGLDRIQIISGRHADEVYLSDLPEREHELYVRLRRDGLGVEEAREAAGILAQ